MRKEDAELERNCAEIQNILSPAEWGARKRKLWDTIHRFIVKNKKVLNNNINGCVDEKEKLQKIETPIFNYLEKITDLLVINCISGQERTVSDFTQQFIVAIWLMNKEIPAKRNIIKNMSELDYKIINQIAEHLGVNLTKAKTGKRIDPDLLRKISDALQHEIQRYNLGLEPESLGKIGDRLGVNQSVISYWGKKKVPKRIC